MSLSLDLSDAGRAPPSAFMGLALGSDGKSIFHIPAPSQRPALLVAARAFPPAKENPLMPPGK